MTDTVETFAETCDLVTGDVRPDSPSQTVADLPESVRPSNTDRAFEPALVAAGGVPVQDPPSEPAPRIGRNIGALACGQIVTWSMTLIWTLVVPRILGPAELGLVVSAQSVSGVLAIVLGFGTRQYLVREMVVAPAEGPRLVGTAIIIRLLLAPIVALAAVVWTRLAHDGAEASIVLYLITAMTIFMLLTEPMQAAFQALERMKYMALSEIITKTAQSVIGVGLVLIGFKAVGIAMNMAAIAAVVILLNFLWLRPFVRISFRTNLQRIRSMAKESLAYWAFGVFGYFYLWIDTIMLSLMTQPRVVGWYGATTQLFQTLMFLPVLVSNAWLPRLVAAFTESRDELIKAARTPLEFILVISAPLAAGTAIGAGVLIPRVYGPAYVDAVPIMIALAFCIPAIYMNIMLAQVLLAEKRQRVWTVVMAGAAVVNPLMNLILIPYAQTRYHNGAIGAAVALTLTEVLMDIIGFVLVGRRVFDRSVLRRTALAISASAGMCGAYFIARPLGSIVALCAAAATLALLTIALRIPTRQERAIFARAVTKLRPQRPVRSNA